MHLLLQQDWPQGEETYSSVFFVDWPAFPVIVVIAVVVLVGGICWYRIRKRNK
jgi:hypothetical protein